MNAPQPESFDLIFEKRDELLALQPGQRIDNAEIIATCEAAQEISDIFSLPEEETVVTYTRG